MEINKKEMDYLSLVIKQHWHMFDTDMPEELYELC